jgi:hypothetical protein
MALAMAYVIGFPFRQRQPVRNNANARIANVNRVANRDREANADRINWDRENAMADVNRECESCRES